MSRDKKDNFSLLLTSLWLLSSCLLMTFLKRNVALKNNPLPSTAKSQPNHFLAILSAKALCGARSVHPVMTLRKPKTSWLNATLSSSAFGCFSSSLVSSVIRLFQFFSSFSTSSVTSVLLRFFHPFSVLFQLFSELLTLYKWIFSLHDLHRKKCPLKRGKSAELSWQNNVFYLFASCLEQRVWALFVRLAFFAYIRSYRFHIRRGFHIRLDLIFSGPFIFATISYFCSMESSRVRFYES